MQQWQGNSIQKVEEIVEEIMGHKSPLIEYEDAGEYFDSLFAHDSFYQAKPCWFPRSDWFRTPAGEHQLEGVTRECSN